MITFKGLATIATLLAILIVMPGKEISAKNKKNSMKLKANVAAPSFIAKDVYNKTVDLKQYQGKKVLLVFHRNVGCPVCNLRFHKLEQKTDFFKEKGLVVISIYESTQEHMLEYLEGQTPYTIMIPNPDESLYKLYTIERSKGKIMKGMFHGLMGKAKAGGKLFNKKLKQDGNLDRIGAEFLIDEYGKIIIAKYGDYAGDCIPLEDIKAAL